ncbi:MAG: TIGR03619 family F420-dependent LLM class oxidoreductase [Nonomuraea sp.]|nr:TIGR03619 family F420-dependent LLM class oxidoreductase [Nonomuraea sp.]
MELGIGLPAQGSQASPEALVRIAENAERAGLGSVWAGERLMRPAAPRMPGMPEPMPLPDTNARVFDPLETLAFVAARTSTIKLGTSVVSALLHNPLVLARRLATLDVLSGGRTLIGLGQGWMEQEFAATGVPVSRRGAGFEDHLAAMRAVWGPDPVSYDGRFYQISEAEIGPKPVGMKVLAGAGAPAAVERAARLGLGLTIVGFAWDQIRQTISTYGEAGGPIVVHVNGGISDSPLDQRMPLTGSAEQVAEDLTELEKLGVDHVFWLPFDSDWDEQLVRISALSASR